MPAFSRPPSSIALLVLLVAYFLCFTSRGALTYFNSDDVTNLYLAWIDPVSTILKGAVFFWSGYIRPLGALFYRLLYAVAGFHPLPFHIAAFAILIVNLGLLYRAIWLLTGSRQITFFTVLISCFHGRMWDIFASTGTIYDILSQTFLLLALGFYIQARRLPPSPLWKQILLFGCLGVAAVDAKEMGAALPMILLMCELCHGPEPGNQSLRQHLCHMQPVWITGFISGIFFLSRFTQRTPISGLPAYTLTFTPQRYLETTQSYFNLLLYNGHLTEWQSVLILVICLGIALALRSRWMLLGWLYYFVALLPLSFATPRFGYVLYIPLVGCALYVATFVTLVKTKLLAHIPVGRREGDLLNFAVLAAFFAAVFFVHYQQSKDLIARAEGPGGQSQIRAIAREIYSRYPTLRSGADLVLVNNPLGDRYVPMFALRLRYHDPKLRITQLLWNPKIEPLSTQGRQFDHVDHVLLFNGNTAVEIRGDGAPPSYAQLGTPESILNIVKDVDCCERGHSPWAYQNPILRFQVPELQCAFVMDFIVPDVILRQAGPLQVTFSIGSEKPDSIVVHKGGEQHYESPALRHLVPGQIVLARIYIANPFIATDGAKLSFIMVRAGLNSRKRGAAMSTAPTISAGHDDGGPFPRARECGNSEVPVWRIARPSIIRDRKTDAVIVQAAEVWQQGSIQ